MRSSTALAALAAGLLLLPRRGAGDLPKGAFTGIPGLTNHPKFVDAQISPRGTYLAAVALEGGKRTLAFVDLKTRKLASRLTPAGETMVGSFHWANDERVVVELIDQDGDLAAPKNRGELYAVDATGKSGRLVFGYRAGEMQAGSHLRKAERTRAWAEVVDTLQKDDRRVLVETISWDEVGDQNPQLHRLDVYTGVKEFVTQSPIPEGWFLTDENGEPRIVSARDEQVKPKFYYREPGESWREFASMKGFTANSGTPVGFLARSREVYLTQAGSEGFSLFIASIDTGERKLLTRNASVPPRSLLPDPVTRRIIAVEYEPDVPTYEFIEPDHPLCRALRGLQEAYPRDHVRLLNTTDDGKKAVARVYSDRNPGQFLLVDVEKLSAEPVVDVRPWIRPDEMAETNAFHINASDGFRIHGYVTLPRSTSRGSPPPLVVLPHGGPHFVRDSWEFDPTVQLLAGEGFAVLQVNYRGSGGYGRAYQEAGYRKWGDRVVQDIVDATRFAVRKGFGDAKRICAFGGSFGAYAAVQSAILAPDLFRCAVGYSGIYDLARLSSIGDVGERRLGRGFIRTVVGDDEAALKRASPVHNAEKVRVPVLLVHGKEDRRAPIEHAELLRKALERTGNAPGWLVEDREGHGFYDEGARERMFAKVLSFLSANTQPAQPVPAPPAQPASAPPR